MYLVLYVSSSHVPARSASNHDLYARVCSAARVDACVRSDSSCGRPFRHFDFSHNLQVQEREGMDICLPCGSVVDLRILLAVVSFIDPALVFPSPVKSASRHVGSSDDPGLSRTG
jgi:hypothetical protein